jgi:hypothetical protein
MLTGLELVTDNVADVVRAYAPHPINPIVGGGLVDKV